MLETTEQELELKVQRSAFVRDRAATREAVAYGVLAALVASRGEQTTLGDLVDIFAEASAKRGLEVRLRRGRRSTD